MGPNYTKKIRGENAKSENSKLGGKSDAPSTAVDGTDTKETKENTDTNGGSGKNLGSNASLLNSQQGYDTGGGYRAQPANLGMINNWQIPELFFFLSI